MKISMSRLGKSLPVCLTFLAVSCAPTPRPVPPVSSPVKALIARGLASGDALFIGAGDIAAGGRQHQNAVETGNLIKMFPTATVFTTGDNAYRNGTDAEFRANYDTAWGSFKERTRPSPGNHDYGIYLRRPRNNAIPYFNYFGANAGSPGSGYYSYNLGGWHIVSLNSMADQPGAPTMTDQVNWLKQDLEHNEKRCILAYWHHPLFSSGDEHGDQTNDPGRSMQPLWNVLLDYKADVILNGHDHHYERFALQDASATATMNGIRQFIIGNGGGEKRGIGTVKKNSEKRLAQVYGVLLMTLHSNSYEWNFIRADGTVGDSSSGPNECH